ncbi:DNA gyrase inhibitor YacG [Candidatus Brocadiaceae bacterium B188]|nr:DNA gyrase inhibitor YacG [Candidatus Brocadiaceae bacterium B188]
MTNRKYDMRRMNCPHCKKEFLYRRVQDMPTFPFCSDRCKLIDLGSWLDEEYRIEESVGAEIMRQLEKKEREKNE